MLKLTAYLIFIALFNICFFTLNGPLETINASEWISYGFIHMAYICLISAHKWNKQAQGLTVLKATQYVPAIVYFFAQLALGIACIVAAPESPTWPLILQCALFALFLIVQLITVLSNNSTTVSILKQRTESIYIGSLADQIRTRMRDLENPELKKKVTRCYDALNNCSIESFPEAAQAETALKNAVAALCSVIESGDQSQIEKSATAVLYAIQDRNTIIQRCRMQ